MLKGLTISSGPTLFAKISQIERVMKTTHINTIFTLNIRTLYCLSISVQNMNKSIYYLMTCLKIFTEWQTMPTLIKQLLYRRSLIRVMDCLPGMSVWIFHKVTMVLSQSKVCLFLSKSRLNQSKWWMISSDLVEMRQFSTTNKNTS